MSKAPVNVVLITVDCLRADHVGIYGYSKQTTPNIDELGRKAVVFTQAVANSPHTLGSFPSILTSSYPPMYGGPSYLSEERTLISQVLKKNGLVTATFHSNPYLTANRNYNRGFDTFWDGLENMSKSSRIAPKVRKLIHRRPKILKFLGRALASFRMKTGDICYVRGEKINEKAKQWLKNHESNFFIWLHYMDAHYPYLPLDKYLKKFYSSEMRGKKFSNLLTRVMSDPGSLSDKEISILQNLYDAEISYLDNCIGELIAYLRQSGHLQDTLVVVTADHGEQFGEHGAFTHGVRDEDRCRHPLYDELLHVPLMLYCPGILPPEKIEAQVSLIDLAPTIADIVGLKKPGNWYGETLLPLIKESKKESNRVAFSFGWARKHRFISARTVEWKFIYEEKDLKHELYDLNNDPRETTNLYDKNKNSDMVKRFEELIKELFSEISRHQVAIPEVSVDKELKNRLKGLGYLD